MRAVSQFEMIAVESDGPVTTITLNRPERLNACPPQMADEIFTALGGLGDARALLIRGEGRAFCSGADLAVSADSSIKGGRRSFISLQHHYNPMIQTLFDLPIPVVAEVSGPAAGVGCSLALTADFVVAGKSGYFLQAFVNIGLVPDGGSSWFLPRLIGLPRATQMMMLGERIHAEEAERIGLIYKCVEDDALASEARSLVERLANGPTVALGHMKHNVRRGLMADLNTALQNESRTQWAAGDSADAGEGISAFLEKRGANFTGR
ncbi:enoyl-CoA hydratase-related protein [Altererythrobacter arenosus]|uniref:Enoyl-CoA hydratase-related protein n=1 Tax=Altererythrobacter arenosus TaxID=3032592 RepID=A0ABY8FQ23_9SPHN|nr:enoyl-CoA hydratase-related protein [Altererythrobacter sp. CAU 1644]WFL76205.1 enoyl-CoA hydratase-related protein [Altererythrobacter sp. CAU 1644]